MMMVELTSVPSAALPVDALADHLRLSSGFADDGSQDAQLEGCLRSAMAAIEARIGKALIARQFSLTLSGWQFADAQVFPVAPVSSVESVKLINQAGDETIADPNSYVLRADAQRPRIEATASSFIQPPRGGSVEIELTAGYSTDWTGVPHDLHHAWLALAAEFYERVEPGPMPLPMAVLALIEPYRQIRLGGASA